MKEDRQLYAIIRRYAYDPATRADTGRALAEVTALHESQPGYAGSLVIDDGRRWIAVNLWETEHAAAAGRTAIGAQVQRLLEPLTTGSSELIAAGAVLASDREERS